MSSPVTAVMAPVTLTLFCVANAVTTTSSRIFLSSLRMMLNLVLLPVAIRSSVNPMQVTVISALFPISSEKFPSKSVTAPFVVPVSITVAPITGCPLSSTTFPVILFLCCSIAENPSDFTFSAFPGGSAHIRNREKTTNGRRIRPIPLSRNVWFCLVFFIIRKVDKVWLYCGKIIFRTAVLCP